MIKISLRCSFLIFFLFNYFFSISQNEDYSRIDNHAQNAPEILKNNLDSLTKYLVIGDTNDFEKTRSYYVWIANNISYDLKTFQGNKEDDNSPAQVNKTRKATCDGYSLLFKTMCVQAGIKCEIIPGYSKGFSYRDGDIFIKTDQSWNAIFIANKWYLIDLTWGSGYIYYKDNPTKRFLSKLFKFHYIKNKMVFQKQFNDNYFLSDPKIFVLDHLPANPMWQLIDCPISIETFEKKHSDILYELNNSGIIPCYNYKDSINHFESISENKKNLESAEDALQFNEKNKEIVAKAYMELAEINNEFAKKNIEDAVNNYIKAKNLLNSFKEDIQQRNKIRNEQNKNLNTKLDKENQVHLMNNNRLIAKDETILKRNKKENQKLVLENKKIAKENINLKTENIEDVKSSKKVNTPDERKLIEDNLLMIKENKQKIKENKNDLSNLCWNNQEERELFINKNIQEILENHQKNQELIKTDILIKIENNYRLDTSLFANKNAITDNKETEAQLRITSDKEGQAYIDENILIMKKIYKGNNILIKENKRLIKKNKRISSEDHKENEMFLEENKAFMEDNNTILTSNETLISNNKADNQILKKEIKLLKKENILLMTENDLENLRFRIDKKNIHSGFVNEMKKNEEKIKLCNDKMILLKKKISELNKLKSA